MNLRLTLDKSVVSLSVLILVAGCVNSASSVSTDSSPTASVSPASTDAKPNLESGADSPTGTSESSSFQAALDTGMSAAIAAQTAVSQDDWNLVASRWQRAIAQLETIPTSAANYERVQQKIAEYRRNMMVAQLRAQGHVAAVPTPSVTSSTPTAATPNSGHSQLAKPQTARTQTTESLCRSASPSGQPQLELSQLQFYRDGFEPDGDFLVGCLTNNSDQAVRAAGLSYGYSGGNVMGGGIGSLVFPSEVIQPGQTVGFRSDFTVHREAFQVQLSSLNWCWEQDNICFMQRQMSLSTTVSR
ncbi:hypothetical protein H6F93_27360 [Leptolyngbya sp. FACHB-671]|uniref:hypothetical protein n=1 Tax=Leptolyngbya sp. FACHB-671 TaxID=2692812 RepID=UPI0016835DCB|nr:hypothetical protein [Leptolyngbya sp. FACHB-671]MBD2071188.1 hypothetical protein [Leptolyngbya sp. FACHB-671]